MSPRKIICEHTLAHYFVDFIVDLILVFGGIIRHVVFFLCLYWRIISASLFNILSYLCSAIANFSFRHKMQRFVSVLND